MRKVDRFLCVCRRTISISDVFEVATGISSSETCSDPRIRYEKGYEQDRESERE